MPANSTYNRHPQVLFNGDKRVKHGYDRAIAHKRNTLIRDYTTRCIHRVLAERL